MGGSKKGGGKQPAPPDPRIIAAMESRYNRLSENTPLGSSSYSEDPVSGQWSRNSTFAPGIQEALNRQIGGTSQLMQRQPFDRSQVQRQDYGIDARRAALAALLRRPAGGMTKGVSYGATGQ